MKPMIPQYVLPDGTVVNPAGLARGTNAIVIVPTANPHPATFDGHVKFLEPQGAGNKFGERAQTFYYPVGDDSTAQAIGEFPIGRLGYRLRIGSGLTIQVQIPVIAGTAPLYVAVEKGEGDDSSAPLITAPPVPAATGRLLSVSALALTPVGGVEKEPSASPEPSTAPPMTEETSSRRVAGGGRKPGGGKRTLADLAAEKGGGKS